MPNQEPVHLRNIKSNRYGEIESIKATSWLRSFMTNLICYQCGGPRDMGPPGRISLVKWGPQGGLIALVFWGSPRTHAGNQLGIAIIKEYLTGGVCPDSYDKQSKNGLRKRRRKIQQHIKIAIARC